MKHFQRCKIAFTLSEVLITIAIIGIAAAITIPILVSKYNKLVVETRLKNFYSVMNQAIKMSEADYGDFQYWDVSISKSDADGMETWWNTYFAPHIKTLKIEKEKTTSLGYALWVYLADGTKFMVFNYYYGTATTSTSTHIYFYPKSNNSTDIMGKDFFTFFMRSDTNRKTAAVEPYKFSWDGTEEDLRNGKYGCNAENTNAKHYCTALIQYYGWKIPDNYPYRF